MDIVDKQNGVIRGTLLAQRFMGTDRGGQGGVVINTGSNVSVNPYVSVPIYSATKAAIVSFTRAFGVSSSLSLKFISANTPSIYFKLYLRRR